MRTHEEFLALVSKCILIVSEVEWRCEACQFQENFSAGWSTFPSTFLHFQKNQGVVLIVNFSKSCILT